MALALVCLTSVSALAQSTGGKAVALKGTDFFRTTLWSPALFDTESFTFEFWFQADGPGVLVGESDTENVNFWDKAFAEVFAGGVIKAGVPDVPTVTVGTVTFGTWHHLAVVYDQSALLLSVYLDGSLAATSPGNRKTPAENNNRTAVYPFGRGGPTNMGGGSWFTGKFDEVRIWRIPLTASQIAATWNKVMTTDATGLMALWHFDMIDPSSNSQSPDSRALKNDPALYVPVTETIPLVVSSAPFQGAIPVVVTGTSTIVANNVTIRGTANPELSPLSVYFEWGLTAAYGNNTTTNDIGNGSLDVAATESLTSLKAGTYHYRLVGISGTDIYRGADQIFTVVSPTVATGTAIVDGNNATLQASANAHGFAISGYFEWGTSTTYGNSTTTNALGTGTAISMSDALINLSPGFYHFRPVVTTDQDVYVGNDATFTILGPAAKSAKVSGTDYLRTTTWSNDIFGGTEDFTFELWFNASGPGVLIDEADTVDPSAWDYAFAEVFPGGIIKAGVPGVATFEAGTVSFGTWHSFSLVYSSADRKLYAYLDGQLSGSGAGDRQTPKEANNRTSVYTFGRGGEHNLGGGAWLVGQFDEIRIWNRALSASQIAFQFDKIINLTDPNLMGNWHLDAVGTPTYTSPDASGKNNSAWHVPEGGAMPLANSGALVTPDPRPSATTESATLSGASVNLSGTGNSGAPGVAYFRFGQNTTLDQTTDSVPISGGTKTTIQAVLQDLVPLGSYSYSLVVSNEFGVAEGAAKSFIAPSAPQILQQPANLVVSQTKTGKLTVQAVGTGTLTYQWRHEGTNLPAATTATYTIASATTNQAGIYDVVISNNVGSTNSVVVTVTVRDIDRDPPVVTITSPAVGPRPSEKFTLEGTITDNQDIALVTWELNGFAKGALTLTNGNFTVPNVTMALHSNNLVRVIATDAFANKATNEVSFYWDPPRTFVLSTPPSVQEGSRVTIPISLVSTGGVGGATFAINWDTNYLADPVFEWSDAVGSAFTSVNLETPKRYRATFALPGTEIPSGTNLLATISFRSRSVASALASPVTIDLVDVDSPTGNQLTTGNNSLATAVGITPRKIKGDNNANNRLDVGDASVIMRFIALLDIPRSWDVTGNDLNDSASLDSGDAIKVLRAVVGIDPQPVVPAGLKAGDGGGGNGVSLSIDKQMVQPQPGDKVTIDVRISDQTKPIAGASFRLEYPVDALRLDNATANQIGPIVPATGVLAAWNVSPNINDYANQNGAISLGVSSATAWPTNNGVLARFTFTVQANAANRYSWPIQVKNLEVSHDGFETDLLGGAALNFLARAPSPASFDSSVAFGASGAARLTLQGDLGATYVVQGSSDLTTWKVIGSFTTTTSGAISIDDPDSVGATTRFYKATLVQ